MDKAKQDSKTKWVYRWNNFTDGDNYKRDLREKYLPTELSERLQMSNALNSELLICCSTFFIFNSKNKSLHIAGLILDTVKYYLCYESTE